MIICATSLITPAPKFDATSSDGDGRGSFTKDSRLFVRSEEEPNVHYFAFLTVQEHRLHPPYEALVYLIGK